MDSEKNREIDWATIEAEYVNSAVSLTSLAEKYSVSKSIVQKRSAKYQWSRKRERMRQDKAKKVSDKLHDKDVNHTVKSIERCCKAADKLIDKINKAINQVDKEVYVSYDSNVKRTRIDKEGDTEVTYTENKRQRKTKRIDALIDTKKISELSKSLLNIKQILTGEDGNADKSESSGIIEIVAASEIDEREDDNEQDGMASAAETGGNDVSYGG